MSLHKPTGPLSERCVVRDVLDRVSDRWSLLVLMALEGHGTLRFTAFKTHIPDVSQRMLAQTLRRLEQDGLVLRTPHPTIPPRVDYKLTTLGTSLLKPLKGLVAWAEQHHGHVRKARKAYISPQRQAAL